MKTRSELLKAARSQVPEVTPADLNRQSPKPVILDVRDAKTYERSPVRIPNSHHVTPQSLEATRPDLDIAPDRTLVAYCT